MIVLESTLEVVKAASQVSIDDAAIERWAAATTADSLSPSGHELLGQLGGTQSQVANLVLLIDALNFCFWSSEPITVEWRGRRYERFEAMMVSLMLAARQDARWYEAKYWLEVPSEEIRRVLAGKGELLLMEERERIIRETGRIVVERFDGEFIHAIESVAGRAWPLAVLLMTEFDSFRDVSAYRGRMAYFMKRAQICALDVSVAWQLAGCGGLAGVEVLSAMADYRLPQALRHLGIMRLSSALEASIEMGEETEAGSEAEVEIRACTVQAVERMVKAMAGRGVKTAAWAVDWHLWALSHRDEVRAKHHKTRTVYY